MADNIFRFLHLLFVEIPVAIAWPAVVLFLGLSHRSELRSFLSRLTKIGPSGAEAIPPQALPEPNAALSKPEEVPAPPSVPAVVDHPSGPPPSSNPDPVLARIENNLLNNLKERGQEQLSNEAQKQLFISEYAKLVLSSHFEKVQVTIFGTQIAALQYLHIYSPQPRDSLRQFYNNHVSKVNNRELTDRGNFDIWFSYLITSYLVVLSVDSTLCYISDIGSKFVTEFAPAHNVNEITRFY